MIVDRTTIQVEQIKGGVFLISGKDDKLAPSGGDGKSGNIKLYNIQVDSAPSGTTSGKFSGSS
jgi:hypothetical protein